MVGRGPIIALAGIASRTCILLFALAQKGRPSTPPTRTLDVWTAGEGCCAGRPKSFSAEPSLEQDALVGGDVRAVPVCMAPGGDRHDGADGMGRRCA